MEDRSPEEVKETAYDKIKYTEESEDGDVDEKDHLLSMSDGEGNKSNRKRTLSTASTVSQKKKVRLMKIRTICLVIALMVHSLFEGLTVGLQTKKTGVCILVALLAFHKCLVGFSLGIALVNDKSDFRSFQKKAVCI